MTRFVLIAALTLPAFASAAPCAPSDAIVDGSIGLSLEKAEAGFPLPELELHGVEPDEIDLRFAGVEPDEIDNRFAGVEPDEIDDSYAGVEPDEIDNHIAEEACEPTIVVSHVAIDGLDAKGLDEAYARKLLASTSAAQTREHILLASATETTTTFGVVALTDLSFYVEDTRSGPAVYADLVLSIVDYADTPRSTPEFLYLPETLGLMPSQSICPPCSVND